MPELHWLGDGGAKREARRVSYRLLTPVEQVGDPAAQNLLIQGYTLEALAFRRTLFGARLGQPGCSFIMATHASKAGQSMADQIRTGVHRT